MIEWGGEVSRGAECRLQTSGCACVPYMALIYQGLEAQKVMGHGQKLDSMRLASKKGLFLACDWRIMG